MDFNYPAKSEIIPFITQLQFKDFDQHDWDAFAGCETSNPKIAYTDELAVVIDGSMINIVHHEDEYGGVLYNINQIA